MLLLATFALADDKTWQCTELTRPADVLAWSNHGDPGAGAAGRAAADQLFAYVEDGCVADCASPYAETCPARSCVTAAGDTVSFESVYEGDWDTYGSSERVDVTVTVEPADPAAAGFSSAVLVQVDAFYDGSGSPWNAWTSWDVSWVGTLRADWPADAGFWAAAERSNEGSGESWDDGTCAWRYQSDVSGYDVTMNGRWLWVSGYPYGRTCSGVSLSDIGAVTAYIDGEQYGLVVPETWEDVPGTDADGDHWTVENGDCDDADPTVYCWAEEVPDDGVDQNCDGAEAADTGDTAAPVDTASPTDTATDTALDTAPADTAADDTADTAPAPRPAAPDDEAPGLCGTAGGAAWLGLLVLPILLRRSPRAGRAFHRPNVSTLACKRGDAPR